MATVKTRRDPGYWTECLTFLDQPIAEVLSSASCDPACQAIAACAIGAWQEGWTPAQWRQDALARQRDDKEVQLIAEAEDCMRGSGLWPWSHQD